MEFVTLKSYQKQLKEAMLSEVKLLRRLKNRHVIGYHNWYETRNHFWLILDYLPGGNLKQVLKEDKGLVGGQICLLSSALIEGLAYLHSERVVYVDFKPSNFVFDEYNNLKFADFAVAMDLDDPAQIQEGAKGSYIAPEVTRRK